MRFPTNAYTADLFATRMPGEFTLDALSLYELPPKTAPFSGFAVLLCLLHRARLASRSGRSATTRVAQLIPGRPSRVM